MPRGVLITRPGPQAMETAQLVAGRGYQPHIAPMLVIEPVAWARALPAVQAVLVTSANALPSLAPCDRQLPVFAVGDASAQRAGQMGFTRVVSAGRDAQALAELVAGLLKPDDGALLLPCAEGQTMALARDLRARGFRVLRRVAYRARPATQLSEPIRTALDGGTISHAMFFSTETALAFVRCISDGATGLDRVEALSISHRAARVLADLPFACIRVAAHPNQDEMVALLP